MPQPAVTRRTATRSILLPHLVWEAVLLLSVIVVTVLAIASARGHFFQAGVFWPGLAFLGCVAGGLALSLRAGTPNLAVASIATLSSLIYVTLAEHGWPAALAGLVAVLACLVVGGLMALIAGLTPIPGWAVSLVGLAFLNAISLGHPQLLVLPRSGFISVRILDVFAGLFVLGSLAGGVLWLLPALRETLRVSTREGGYTGGRGPRLLAALVGLGGSSLLAAISGVLFSGYIGATSVGNSANQLLVAFGAVLIGGVSIFGGSGGVAGTVFGTYLLSGLAFIGALHAWPFWLVNALPAAFAILVGLFVSWLLDWFTGRGGEVGDAPRPYQVPGSLYPAQPAPFGAPPPLYTQPPYTPPPLTTPPPG